MGREGKYVSVAEVRAMAQETLQPMLDSVERLIVNLRERDANRLTPEQLNQCEANLRAGWQEAVDDYTATIEKTIRGWIAETN